MPTLETDYHVEKGEVTLSVIIGDAQVGSSLVKLDGKEVVRGDEITNHSLGKGSELKGEQLTVKTVVTDVNDRTNHTSVTYDLKGGTHDSSFYLDATVQNEGDSVVYRATFNLV